MKLIKNLQTNKSPGPDDFTGEFYLSFWNSSKKLQRKEHSQAHSMRPRGTWKYTQHHKLLEKSKSNYNETTPRTIQNGHH